MNSRRRAKIVAEINVVPYIDVMLVLLVIFMITAPVLTQGIRVDLPKVNAPPVPPKELVEPLIVTVNLAGDYFINLGQGEEIRPIGRDELAGYVTKVMNNRDDVPVFVRGATGADYGKVLDVLALIQRAGAPFVNLVTAPPDLDI